MPELGPGHVGVAYADARFDDARLNLADRPQAPALAGAAVTHRKRRAWSCCATARAS